MKLKLPIFLGFVAALFLAGILSTTKNKDMEIGYFIENCSEVKKITAEIGEFPTIQSVNEAQIFFDANKIDLKTQFENLQPLEQIQASYEKKKKLVECIETNKRHLADVYGNYHDKILRDLQALEQAREEYDLKKDNESLNKRKDLLKILEADQKLLEEIKKLVSTFRSIFEQTP